MRRRIFSHSDQENSVFGHFSRSAKVSNSKTKSIKCTFLLVKSRLAPLKLLTIPRLELQAAVLAVRLKEKMIHQVDFEFNEVYFPDSQIILSFIGN